MGSGRMIPGPFNGGGRSCFLPEPDVLKDCFEFVRLLCLLFCTYDTFSLGISQGVYVHEVFSTLLLCFSGTSDFP